MWLRVSSSRRAASVMFQSQSSSVRRKNSRWNCRVASVKPQMKPGWEATTKSRKLDPPIQDHERTVSEAVDERKKTGMPQRWQAAWS